MNSFKLEKYKFVKDLTDEYPSHLIFYPLDKIYVVYNNEIYFLKYLWEFKLRKRTKISKKYLKVSIQPLKFAKDFGAIEIIRVRDFFKEYVILSELEIEKVSLLL